MAALGDLKFGGLFGGLAEGAGAGMQLDQTARDHMLKQLQMLRTQQQMDMTLAKDFAPKFREAFLEQDAGRRNATIGALMEAWSNMSGQPVDKRLISYFKQNPEDAATMLKNIEDRGGSIVDVFKLAGDPLKFATLLGAHGNAESEARRRAAIGGESRPMLQVEPGGSGLQVPGAPRMNYNLSGTQTGSTAQGGIPALTPEIDAEVRDLERQNANDRERIAAVAREGAGGNNDQRATAQYIGDIQAGIRTREQLIYDLRIKPYIDRLTQAYQVVPTADIDAARKDASYSAVPDAIIRSALVPGMRRDEFERAVGNLRLLQQRFMQQPTQPSATPSGATPAPAGKITLMPAGTGAQPFTPEAQAGATTQATSDATPLTPIMLTNPTLKDHPEIKTWGDWRKSGLTLMDDVTAASRVTTAQEYAKFGADRYKAIEERGDKAKGKFNLYNSGVAAAERLGPSGEWVTPIRGTLAAGAAVFGWPNALGQNSREIIKAITPSLAMDITSMMKGQQSDRELAQAMLSVPNANMTPKGLALMLYMGKELTQLEIQRQSEARRWVAKHPDNPSVMAKDKNGFTFDEAFKYHYEDKLNLFGKISEKFKMSPAEIYNEITGTKDGDKVYNKIYNKR